ncbi:nucleotidyltransferase family protein [Actinokineospora bangkokensis]|uniref:MobA-like NTP transferase domain-containing protein n=1 Tax=Actinokineospora bangkokensis TaxID=1193682 RepID=A0A1Q9LPM7_9PSEU|nr:nucleotidyltransferase family protein [Actinokineospora bangkokensis]OLR93972.1 hypothetical protein BJP25_13345 [Actinokineospora bangkokensis]
MIAGVLLAAGAGRRFGAPKALVRLYDRPLVAWAAAALGGCDVVVVVLGAAAERVRGLVGPDGLVVVNPDWAGGMGSSLRAGLAAVPAEAEAAVVLTVDTPGIPRAAVERVAGGATPASLARATWDGVPGHPVVLGRDHWAGVRAVARGDVGARAYLRGREVRGVECGDLGWGVDVDTPADLDRLVELMRGGDG